MPRIPLLLALLIATNIHASGLSPDDAVKAMKLPPGFHAALVAAEPDVVQPVAFEFDDRGRLWVAEFISYPKWAPEGHDRIILLEDTDGDGRMDKRTVIWDKGNYITGFTLGHGGIWVVSAPNLLFIPCDFNADKPVAGEPQILLDGWSHAGVHNIVCNLNWGPDGWLYGGNGVSSRSRVAPPGTPDSARTFIDGGIWRYHPVTKKLEQVCTGMTNPWGMDWDGRGELFATNNVTAHLHHIIPGARFERMHEQDQNPYTYELMGGIADHQHYEGNNWTASRGGKGIHGELGGGHSHVGALIYSGGGNWPEEYRDTIFMCNTHGNRINNDKLELTPTGYVAHHRPDFMLANDTSFRGVTLKWGPEGAMFVSDWHQDGECHSGSEVTTGRIFKINFGYDLPVLRMDNIPSQELLQNYGAGSGGFFHHIKQKFKMFSFTKWQDLHARRILFERQVMIVDYGHTFTDEDEYLTRQKMTASWLPGFRLASSLVQDNSQTIINRKEGVECLFSDINKHYLSNGLSPSHNLILLTWYGIEPLVESDPVWALSVFRTSKIPALRPFIARRLSEHKHELVVAELTKTTDTAQQLDLLTGMAAALKGRIKLPPPPGWKEWYEQAERSPNPEVKALTQQLAALFGDTVSLDALKKIVEDRKTANAVRINALNSLLDVQADKLVPVLHKLAHDPDMRRHAIRALARYDDAQTAPLLLGLYDRMDYAEKSDTLTTLASRPASARALFAALQKNTVAKSDLNAAIVRALEAHGIAELDDWLKTNWGLSRKTAADKAAEITRLKTLAESAAIKIADATHGRELFTKNCANCHTLFGTGGKVGPDLTGSARANLDYLLQNIVDPNAIVPQEYLAWMIKTKDGRVLNGLIRNEKAETLDVLTGTETLTLRLDDIAIKKRGDTSMMPEGILNTLKDTEILDLLSYLQSTGEK